MPQLPPSIAGLAPYLPYLALLLLLLLLGVIGLTLLATARRPRQPAPAASASGAVLSPRAPKERRRMLFGMRQATRRLQGTDLAYDHPYSVPWFILLGGAEAQPRRLTEALEPAEPADPGANSVSGRDYRVAFLKEGAIVEIDPHLLGTAGWIERWEPLLWLLRAARPERPADGMVLAVPTHWLIGPEALPPDRLADHSAQLYEAIWRFQRHTGLRIPIYLAITGAERLEGFAALAEAVPTNLRDEILGWATPDETIEAFDPDQVEAAVDTLVTGLGALQLQILGAPRAPATDRGDRRTGDLLLLPAEIHRLAGPLRLLLSNMLRASVYHEPFLFRGFYLTGSVAQANELGHEAFVRGLFRRKIFREFQMARPARGVVTARTRRLRIAQACLAGLVLLSATGLIAESVILPRRAAALAPALRILDRETHQALAARPTGVRAAIPSVPSDDHARVDQPVLERQVAGSLLWTFSALPITTASLIAPTSLLEMPDERVIRALTVGYDRFVLEAIRDGLERRGRDLATGIAPRDPDACGNPVSEGTPAAADIARFQKLAGDTQELDQNIRLFTNLTRTNSIPTLELLVHYALGLEMPPDFSQDTRLYRLALAETKAPTVDMEALRTQLRAGLANAFIAAAAAQFDAGAVSQAVSQVSELSIEINGPGLDGSRVLDLLRQLRAQLRIIQNAVSGNSLGWVGGSGDLGGGLQQPLALLRQAKLDLLPAAFADALEKQGQACRQSAQHNLMALAGFGGLTVLEQGDNGLTLSPRFRALGQGLDALFAEDFMTAAPAVLGTGDGGRRVAWDAPLVETAEQALERYSAIMTSSVAAVPVELRSAVRTAAQYQLTNFVLGRVAAARRVRPDDGGFGGDEDNARRGEIRNFATVAPLLANLQSGLDQIGLAEAGGQIAQIGDGQAQRLLAAVSRRLDDAMPYQPIDPSFTWWTGEPPLAARAFGTATQADLAAQIGAERDFISALAENEAQPLVSFLGRGTGFAPGAPADGPGGQITLGAQNDKGDNTLRWAGILEALDRYDHKAHDSTLSLLESFILTGMDQIDLAKCREAIAVPASGFDYFGQRLQRLERELLDRCSTLQRDRVQKQYGQVANLFNQTLAGRFPFVAESGGAKIAARADPDDIRRFYALLDHGGAGAMVDWVRSLYGPSSVPAAAFLEQIEAIRPALAPLIADPSPDQPPTWEADVEFRTNPQLDRAGNQVLEWTLEGQGQRVSSLQPPQPFVWSYGQPVRLTLRWARNAPSIPAADQDGQPMVRDVNATWRYDDPWGLLSLIEDHSARRETFLPIGAREPETIVLKLPLMKNPEAAAGGDLPIDQAMLFVRLRLHAVQHGPGQPDKRIPIVLANFPTLAPLL